MVISQICPHRRKQVLMVSFVGLSVGWFFVTEG